MNFLGPLWSEFGKNKTVKARLRSWLEPFFRQTSLMFSNCPLLARQRVETERCMPGTVDPFNGERNEQPSHCVRVFL
jgi:hypothetical protein